MTAMGLPADPTPAVLIAERLRQSYGPLLDRVLTRQSQVEAARGLA